MKIKNQLILASVISAAVPLLIVGSLFVNAIEDDITKSTLDHLYEYSVNTKHSLMSSIHLREEIVDAIASRTAMRQTLALYGEDLDVSHILKLESILNDAKLSNHGILEINLSDRNGNVVASTGNNKDQEILSEEYFADSIEGQTFVEYRKFSNESGLFFSKPLIYEDNIVGVITIQFLDEYITNLSYELGETGEIILAKRDVNGDALFISTMKFDPDSAFNRIVTKDQIDVPITHALQKKNTIFDDKVDYRGIPVLSAVQYIEQVDLGIVVKQDKEEAYAIISDMETYAMITLVTIIGVIVFTSLYFSNLITHSIRKLYWHIKTENTEEKLESKGPDEVKELINSFNEMVERRKKLDLEKDEFLSMVSHEIKTPLVPIFGNLEMLLEKDMLGEINQEQLSALQDIQKNAKRLHMQLDNLSMINDLSLKKISPRKENILITKLFDDMERYFASEISQNNITFVKTIKNLTTITSDSHLLKTIFLQLIRNAISHLPSEDGKIEICVEEKDENILFCVKDNGSGIPKENQKELFKKFYQVDTSIARTHEGLGVGLSVCHGIVELFNGKIWVESDGADKGTTIYFSIPKNHELS